MKRTFLLLYTALLAIALWAQNQPLARIYTDKECYLTGENLWIKVCVNDAAYPGNAESRVAYVEVSDSKQIHAQGKVALQKGTGWACIHMPQTMHSGIYRLTVYTHYMRNLDPENFPTRHIAVLNARTALAEIAPEPDSTWTHAQSPAAPQAIYGKREKVTLQGTGLWHGLQEATLSVVRSDVDVCLPQEAATGDLRPGKEGGYLVEFEGHIVKGRLTTPLPADANAYLACVGKSVHLFEGKIQPDSTFYFFTNRVYNQRDMVLSVSSDRQESGSIEPISPFAGVLPDSLPALHYSCDEQALAERSIAAQLNKLAPPTPEESAVLSELLFNTTPARTYNIDEYVRFNTLHDALIEYVREARVSRINGVRRIEQMNGEELNTGFKETLVLLDGVPVEDHEALLQYRPRFIHYLHQYKGRYSFGGKMHEGVISLISHKGTFPNMRVDEGAQMFAYEFPQERPVFPMQPYDTPEQKASRLPDFRHTLYWQPELTEKEEISFYTSDMTGTYVVTVQGVTAQGESVKKSNTFRVE